MPLYSLAKWLGPRIWLKMMFQAWALAMMRIVIDSQNTERVRLEKMVGKKKSGSL